MIEGTIVFAKTWEAMNATDEAGERLYRYIVHRGSSRSSKTISLIDAYDLYCRSNVNKRATVWRDTKIDCKKTVLVDALKRLKTSNRYKVDQDFNKTESIFTYKTGSTFEIHGTDDEETVHGLTQDCAWFNEPYKISRETFDQIDQRTADFIFIDYNPKKDHWIDDILKDPRAILIESTFRDNPFCPAESRIKILSYQPLHYSAVVMEGLLSVEQARTYDTEKNPEELSKKHLAELIRCQENEYKNTASEFNWCVYGLGTKAEKPNRIFRWNEIPDHEYHALELPTYVGNDWGVVDPWAIVEAKYKDGCLYLHELNYESENQLREKLSIQERGAIMADQSDEIARESGLVVWKFDRLAIPKNRPIICDTNRPLKIAALRRKGYAAEGANKPKGSLLDGLSILENLRVFYTKSSTNIAYEQENYSRKVDRYGVVQEEPEDMDNHTIDAARYVALYLLIRGIIKMA